MFEQFAVRRNQMLRASAQRTARLPIDQDILQYELKQAFRAGADFGHTEHKTMRQFAKDESALFAGPDGGMQMPLHAWHKHVRRSGGEGPFLVSGKWVSTLR